MHLRTRMKSLGSQAQFHQKHIVIAIAIILLVGFALIELGGRQIYMYSSDATSLRLAIFVVMSAATLYLVFIRKTNEGNTSAQQLTGHMLPKAKAIWTAKYVLSTLVFFLALSWATIGWAPWGAKFLQGEDFTNYYNVEEIEGRGSSMFLLSLRGGHGERRWLQISATDLPKTIRPGESICISGKSSLFGVSVNGVEHSRCAIANNGREVRGNEMQ